MLQKGSSLNTSVNEQGPNVVGVLDRLSSALSSLTVPNQIDRITSNLGGGFTSIFRGSSGSGRGRNLGEGLEHSSDQGPFPGVASNLGEGWSVSTTTNQSQPIQLQLFFKDASGNELPESVTSPIVEVVLAVL